MIDVSDLQPKPRTITFKGQQIQCKPLRMSHALIISKIGSVLENPAKLTARDIKQTEQDLDELIADLIPDLKGIQLGLEDTMQLISEIMEVTQPVENQELQDAGVSFDTEKKVMGDG